jgi:hypothetical protein
MRAGGFPPALNDDVAVVAAMTGCYVKCRAAPICCWLLNSFGKMMAGQRNVTERGW